MEFQKIYRDSVVPTKNQLGYDIYAYDSHFLYPKTRLRISTGIQMKFPKGVSGYLVPLSCDLEDHGFDILNGFDYFENGVLQIILMNHSDEKLFIERHSPIARLVLISY